LFVSLFVGEIIDNFFYNVKGFLKKKYFFVFL